MPLNGSLAVFLSRSVEALTWKRAKLVPQLSHTFTRALSFTVVLKEPISSLTIVVRVFLLVPLVPLVSQTRAQVLSSYSDLSLPYLFVLSLMRQVVFMLSAGVNRRSLQGSIS